jgi:hypothetical protein
LAVKSSEQHLLSCHLVGLRLLLGQEKAPVVLTWLGQRASVMWQVQRRAKRGKAKGLGPVIWHDTPLNWLSYTFAGVLKDFRLRAFVTSEYLQQEHE